jgi:hypothetical protein
MRQLTPEEKKVLNDAYNLVNDLDLMEDDTVEEADVERLLWNATNTLYMLLWRTDEEFRKRETK